jgi:hypothetical protein
MAYPLATPPLSGGGSHPSPPYAGTFIPELWSTRLIMNFYAQTVLRNIVSFDYENEIKGYGDTIRIPTIPDATPRPYAIDQQLLTDRYGAASVILSINKGFYFNTKIADVYKVQSNIDLFRMLTDVFSNKMRIAIEQEMFAGILPDVPAANRGNTAGALSGNVRLGATGAPLQVVQNPSGTSQVSAIDLVLRLNQVLQEQNVPPDGRWWVVVPPWFAQLLKKSELLSASDMGDSKSVLRTGAIGRIDNMTIYVSNLLPVTTDGSNQVTTIYAGHPYAINFATQISETETVRATDDFGSFLRVLQVYGYKVTKPQALARAYAYGTL